MELRERANKMEVERGKPKERRDKITCNFSPVSHKTSFAIIN